MFHLPPKKEERYEWPHFPEPGVANVFLSKAGGNGLVEKSGEQTPRSVQLHGKDRLRCGLFNHDKLDETHSFESLPDLYEERGFGTDHFIFSRSYWSLPIRSFGFLWRSNSRWVSCALGFSASWYRLVLQRKGRAPYCNSLLAGWSDFHGRGRNHAADDQRRSAEIKYRALSWIRSGMSR